MPYKDTHLKELIIKMYEDNKSQRTIADALNISKSTAGFWINRFLQDDSLNVRAKTGRRRTTEPNQDEAILENTRQDPFKPATLIHRELNLNCLVETVRNRLKRAGLKSRVAAKKEALTEVNRQRRLAFAQNYLDWNYEDHWQYVLFTDEKTFYSYGQGMRVWRPKGHRFDRRYIRALKRSGHVSINVWGSFSGEQGMDELLWINERFNANYYIQHMLPLIDQRRHLILMHDNAPIHRAHAVQQWLDNRDILVLDWPAKSPDLNPIENLWAHAERLTKNRNPRNQAELWEIVRNAWNEMREELDFREYIRSMPRRIARVVENEGYWTKY